MGITPYDEGDLLVAPPSLYLGFVGQSFVNVVVGFPLEQAGNVIAIGESLEVMELVLKDPTVEAPFLPRRPRPRPTGS